MYERIFSRFVFQPIFSLYKYSEFYFRYLRNSWNFYTYKCIKGYIFSKL